MLLTRLEGLHMGQKPTMRGSEEGIFRGRGSRFEFLNNVKNKVGGSRA